MLTSSGPLASTRRWFCHGARRSLLLAALSVGCLPGARQARAGDPAAPAPSPAPASLVNTHDDDRFQFAFENAICFDLNNPNHYVINPYLLILRWQPTHTEQFFHTPITFTRQYEVNADIVPFWRGPEQHYFGGGVGVRLLYGKTGSHFSFFIEGRLAVGGIDSSGPPHGEGQDLTFNPMGDLGIMYRVANRQQVSLGVLYSHFSNAGLSEPERPNIGINTLGPMVEWNFKF